MIYFDHAATSFPKPPAVAAAVTEAIGSFGNPSRSAHAYALAAGRCAEYARLEIGELFHCPRPERIAFTKNVTEALNIAIQSVDGHIVTTAAEHNSVLRPAHSRPHTIVPVDAAGYYTLADIAGAVRPDTGAIVVGHASNLTGNIAPV
ncbi:MAG: aminotransferase class V-fold PLP-dependent enzyme, partial [Peptococcaceae bacterium]|nr:aminotransferase class V-fold PLP-dependent enzyme [Peptococcaceae bacterium]